MHREMRESFTMATRGGGRSLRFSLGTTGPTGANIAALESNIGVAAAAHDVRGIRFPGNKAAFSSEALFRQQTELATHDAGLQMLLMAILRAVQHMRPDLAALQLPQLKFTLNVGTAPTSTNKRYAVNLAEPFVERFSLIQGIDPKWCQTTWRVVREDGTLFYVRQDLGGLQVENVRSEDDPEARTRRIELDHVPIADA